MDKELIITKEDVELLKEMKENCLKSSVYDDEKRLLKANAITKFLNLLDTDKKQKEVIDKAIDKINSFIGCCKAEKLESGSDYLHHQYWNMFENFNKQIKNILKEAQNEKD